MNLCRITGVTRFSVFQFMRLVEVEGGYVRYRSA